MASAPKAPDPAATAAAQAQANISATEAGAIVNNMNETTPYGQVGYERIGNIRTSDGNKVPRFKKTVKLSKDQQALLDAQERIGHSVNQIAEDQLGRVGETLSTPIDDASLPGVRDLPGTPQSVAMRHGPEFERVAGDDYNYNQARKRVENSLMDRVDERYAQDRETLESRLAAQGVQPGTEQYRRLMDEANENRAAARFQALMAGGQEQSRLADMARADAGFNNTSTQREYDNSAAARAYNNQARQQQFANNLTLYGADEQRRQQALQEQFARRNQAINETTALASGGQVTQPQFNATFQQGIAAPDVMGATYANYAQRSQNAANLNNAIFGLVGSGISAVGGRPWSM